MTCQNRGFSHRGIYRTEENFGSKKTLANGPYCRVGKKKNFGEWTELAGKTLAF